MIAIDANILLRALLEDDPVQTPIAFRILSDEKELFVPLTVVLEVEWTLRSREKRSNHDIAETLRTLFGQPNIFVQEFDAVAAALTWTDAGMNVADALHLAMAARCSEMLTFDTDFIAAAAKVGGVSVRRP